MIAFVLNAHPPSDHSAKNCKIMSGEIMRTQATHDFAPYDFACLLLRQSCKFDLMMNQIDPVCIVEAREAKMLIRSWMMTSMILWAFTMTADAISADIVDLFQARQYDSPRHGKLLYRMLPPKQYDSSKSYPLVVFFHGAGERGSDNVKQLIHAMSDFSTDAAREKHPCFVVAPQCPEGAQWVDTPWTADSHTMPVDPSEPLRLSLELVGALTKEFSIDQKRIYLTGLSMGGFGVWDAMQRRPDLFAAAVTVCSGGDAALAKNIAHIPVWVFHGDKDPVVKPQRSRDMVEALKQAGGTPRYTEYRDTGHNSWTATYANREVHDWLFAQHK